MASQALIKSGQNLAESEFAQANTSGAAAAGSKLITDQLEKNLELDQEQEKFKWEQERQNDIRENRQVAKEKRNLISLAEKEEAFNLLDRAQGEGLAEGTDWEAYNTDREKWWKDNKTQFLTKTNVGGKLKGRLDSLLKAEDNWKNVIAGIDDANVSDSSEEAKEMQFAIQNYFRNNPDKPPQVVERDGRLVYVIPNPTPGGNAAFEIPIDSVGNSKDGKDILGPYKETTSFDDQSANFESQNKGMLTRFRNGQATQEDVNNIGVWFDRQDYDTVQMQEIASSLHLDDIDLSKYDLTDVNDDGVIDGKDIDANGDGEIDANEKKVLKKLFTEVQLNNPDFKDKQVFNTPKAGVDTRSYRELRQRYDGANLGVEGETLSGLTPDGELYEVRYNETNKHWEYTHGSGNKQTTVDIGGSDPKDPPSFDEVGSFLGATGQQKAAFNKENTIANEKFVKELSTKPWAQAGTSIPSALTNKPTSEWTDKDKQAYAAWRINNPDKASETEIVNDEPGNNPVDSDQPTNTPTTDSKPNEDLGFGVGSDGSYTSKQHAGFDKQRVNLKTSVEKLDDLQATACGIDANSQDCKTATKKWETQKKALKAKEEQVARAKERGEDAIKTKREKTRSADIKKTETQIKNLEGKLSQLEGRGKTLSEKEKKELEKLRTSLKELKG